MKMATIKLGAAISDIRGSIGGTVFSRNGGGAYAKARIKGTNPNTAPQQMVRAIISSMFAAWTLLTGAVRTGWANYAANVSMINRLGDVINLSGYNMYTRSRALFEMIGATMPATAPSVMALAEKTEVSLRLLRPPMGLSASHLITALAGRAKLVDGFWFIAVDRKMPRLTVFPVLTNISEKKMAR